MNFDGNFCEKRKNLFPSLSNIYLDCKLIEWLTIYCHFNDCKHAARQNFKRKIRHFFSFRCFWIVRIDAIIKYSTKCSGWMLIEKSYSNWCILKDFWIICELMVDCWPVQCAMVNSAFFIVVHKSPRTLVPLAKLFSDVIEHDLCTMFHIICVQSGWRRSFFCGFVSFSCHAAAAEARTEKLAWMQAWVSTHTDCTCFSKRPLLPFVSMDARV